MKRHLTRWYGVRVLLTWCQRRKLAQIDPDLDDLKAVSPDDLVRFWAKASEWAALWLQARPDWKVNGAGPVGEAADEVPLL